MRGVEEGNVLMGVAFRECAEGALPVATSSVARSCAAGEHPLGILRSRVSPPAGGSRSAGTLAGPDAVRHGGHWPGARCPPLPWVPADPAPGGPPGGRLDRRLPRVLVGLPGGRRVRGRRARPPRRPPAARRRVRGTARPAGDDPP